MAEASVATPGERFRRLSKLMIACCCRESCEVGAGGTWEVCLTTHGNEHGREFQAKDFGEENQGIPVMFLVAHCTPLPLFLISHSFSCTSEVHFYSPTALVHGIV